MPTPRETLLYIPPTFDVRDHGALIVSLHGAGGTGEHGLNLLRAHADESGFAILAPSSAGFSWDVIVRDYGPDVEFLDAALAEAFERCAIHKNQVAIGGFSDGASYALSLGLANGDLFAHVVAFSPGFQAPPDRIGTPAVFVSHGRRDSVLPIERCSRALVPQLRAGGYKVHYVEFEGPHTVPDDIKQHAVRWWLGPDGQRT